MSDNQEQEQPSTSSPQEKYSGSPPRTPISPSLQRASYNGDDMIWPTPSGVYSDAAPTLPKQGRDFAMRINATTLMVVGGVALLLVVALLATTLLRNLTTHPVTQRPPSSTDGALAQGTQGTATVAATTAANGAATNTPAATSVVVSTPLPGGNPGVAPTRGSAPPATSVPPTATPMPPTCDPINPSGSPVTLFGDNEPGGSGSGTAIGSLGTYMAVTRAVSGNECIVTKIQQIVTVNLNNTPETSGSRCGNNPFPCVAQGTLVQTNQSTQQIVFSNANGYGFGNGPVSRNIYGGTDNSPGGGSQCVTGTTSYTDNFGTIHPGGNVEYCWTS